MKSNDYILVLDPGSRETGICVGKNPFGELIFEPMTAWPERRQKHVGIPANPAELLVRTGLLSSSFSKWQDNVNRITVQIVDLLFAARPRLVLVELPSVWYSPRGARSKASGAAQKISLAAGLYFGICMTFPTVRLGYLIEPGEWKGQLPKLLTFRRMTRKYKLNLEPTDRNFNLTDAVGIYDFFLFEAGKRAVRWRSAVGVCGETLAARLHANP